MAASRSSRRDDGELQSRRRGDRPRARLDPYADIVAMAEATPVPVACPETTNSAAARRISRRRSRAHEMADPQLPQQSHRAACSRAEMLRLADVLLRAIPDLTLTADIYETLIYTASSSARSPRSEPRLKPRTLTSRRLEGLCDDGLSGRLLAAPAELIAAMNTSRARPPAAIATVSQAAAVAALDGPQDFLRDRAAEYQNAATGWRVAARGARHTCHKRRAPSTCSRTSPLHRQDPCRRPARSSTTRLRRRLLENSTSPRSKALPTA